MEVEIGWACPGWASTTTITTDTTVTIAGRSKLSRETHSMPKLLRTVFYLLLSLPLSIYNERERER